MADAISAIASLQLGFLQAPEVVREQVPIAAQVQLANAHIASVAASEQEHALETVLQLEEIEGQGVPDATTGEPEGEPPQYGRRRRRPREAVQHKAQAVAAAHPRGVGAMVDVRA